MKKRTYHAVHLNQVDVCQLAKDIRERVVVGVDVAKEVQFAAFMDPQQRVHRTVMWKQPRDTREFVGFVSELRGAGLPIEIAMEPSGTYGDTLRFALLKAGFDVARVNPKRAKDAAEVYDGVPSMHDAKSAAIVAKLHLDGASEDWPGGSEEERTLKAAVRVLRLFSGQFRDNRNRLEGLLARYWPEVTEIMALDSATLLELLLAYGGPRQVAQHGSEATELMRKVGGHFLADEKINAVIETASTTTGVPMVAEEVELVRQVAMETRRCQKAQNKARARVEKLTEDNPVATQMAPVAGKATAAALIALLGEPGRYTSAGAYLKALGLNLKENSSGKSKKGKLRITKRGPGYARLLLYLAALRMIQSDVVVRAWYAKMVKRNGGCKVKAVVAIVRKLAKGLWHVATNGIAFDSHKLFDTTRLSFTPAALELP